MNKAIKITNPDVKKKLDIIGFVSFGGLSSTELNIMCQFIHYSLNNFLCLDVAISSEIQKDIGITQSSFNTSVFRLEKKGVIKKSGKTITLHPIFNNIQNLDKLIIDFTPAQAPD